MTMCLNIIDVMPDEIVIINSCASIKVFNVKLIGFY